MDLRVVILAEQIPGTRNVRKGAMRADGTISRAVLPAISNPEDLNALERALRLKDERPGSATTVLTVGPGRVTEVIRKGFYRGVNSGYLLTDRTPTEADTLAISYVLTTTIRKVGDYDIIAGSHQVINDGTAQVGPQVTGKLGLTQVMYAEETLNVDKASEKIIVKRHIDGGVETMEGPLSIVITISGSAAPCRPYNVKLVQEYKHALDAQEKATIEKEGTELPYATLHEGYPHLNVTGQNVADINGDFAQCGLSDSPARMKTIQNISLQAEESETLVGSGRGIEDLIVELLTSHTIG